jgi:hypothetical protein
MADDVYLMLDADGKVVAVDLGPMMRRHRAGIAGHRADAIDQAAAVFDSAFTTDEIQDMWRASGLSGDDLDAAAGVALELWKIEQGAE